MLTLLQAHAMVEDAAAAAAAADALYCMPTPSLACLAQGQCAAADSYGLLTLFGVIQGSRSPHSSSSGSREPRICFSSWFTDTEGALLLLMR